MSEEKLKHQGNATYLFDGTEGKLFGGKSGRYNSESFWTTTFALFLLAEAKKTTRAVLPVYHYQYSTWEFVKDKEQVFDAPQLSFPDIIIEHSVSKDLFGFNIPIKLDGLKPDIVIMHNNSIQVVEVKLTGRHNIGRDQHDNYIAFSKLAIKHGYKCNVYFLLSAGYENDGDLSMLSQAQGNILLWEDVLKLLCNSSQLFSSCFDERFIEYYEGVELKEG